MTHAPSEAKEQRALSAWARQQWWARGYVHHESATESRATAFSRWRAGARSGFPDVTVETPSGARCAVELKRQILRPKSRKGLWWLAWAEELEADESWHLAKTEPTRHGLKASQAERLAYMQACGWETMVAYGWDEARAWLEAQIGERR